MPVATSTLARKLRLAAGTRALLVNAPKGYRAALDPLPEGARVVTSGKGPFSFVHVFARDIAELERLIPRVVKALEYDGVLWMSYPKGTSEMASDLKRDSAWEAFKKHDLRPVSQVAIDETWSAMRFRPVQEMKTRK